MCLVGWFREMADGWLTVCSRTILLRTQRHHNTWNGSGVRRKEQSRDGKKHIEKAEKRKRSRDKKKCLNNLNDVIMNHALQCIDLKLWFVNIFISWIDRLYVYLCTNILWDAIYVGIAFVLKNLHRFFYFSNTLTAHFILGW